MTVAGENGHSGSASAAEAQAAAEAYAVPRFLDSVAQPKPSWSSMRVGLDDGDGGGGDGEGGGGEGRGGDAAAAQTVTGLSLFYLFVHMRSTSIGGLSWHVGNLKVPQCIFMLFLY